jgi:hypothetical protein
VWKVGVVKHCVLHDTLVVEPWRIRSKAIHRSAWKGYSPKFADEKKCVMEILRSLGVDGGVNSEEVTCGSVVD